MVARVATPTAELDTEARGPTLSAASSEILTPVGLAADPLAPADPRGIDAPRGTDVTPRPDLGPRAAQQVAVALAMNHEGQIELTLDPEELGPVRMGLTTSEGSVTVHLAADRAETLDLLRRHSDILARELKEAGYSSVNFRFGSENPGGGQQAPRHGYDGDARPANPTHSATATPATSPPPPATLRGLGALDLRL